MLYPFLILAIASNALSAPTSDVVLHEKRHGSGLTKRERVAGDTILPIRIALTQSNLENGYHHLLQVSDPYSPQYGVHWTTEEIHREFAPSSDTTAAVVLWLEDHGFDGENLALSASRGWLALDMPARDAELLFSAEYYEQLDEDGSIIIACDEYHVPKHLSKHIDYVSPGIMVSPPMKKIKAKRFSNPIQRRKADTIPNISPNSTAQCGTWITPACLKALYEIPNATLNQPENTLGIFAFEDYYDQEDLDLFYKYFAPWVREGTHPSLAGLNGAKGRAPTKDGGVEAIVDLDIAYGLLYPQDVTFYASAANEIEQKTWIKQYGPLSNASSVTAFLPLVAALDGAFCTDRERASGADCGTIELTKVLSVSYGSSELQAPERAAKRICDEFMKLGLKGHTIIFATADEGVAQRPATAFDPSLPPSNGCVDPNHVLDPLLNGTVFNPPFPASCPWVTAVGATQLSPGQTVNDPEAAMHVQNLTINPYASIYSISSGGGFSNYFPMPSYQITAVSNYFSRHDPGYPTYVYEGKDSVGANGGIYASGGRAYPDFSANGARMVQFVGGEFLPTGQYGASLAAPIASSIITLINQQRTLAGKGPVGFINPVIYEHPEAFTDITKGNNPGCGTEGFPAVEGWDPITGLGTPIYPKLLEIFIDLP